ncbi:MAG TPA: hydrogenase formation protein HypD [Candidatus Bipolaricaulis anaerobius]|jgi:hydrogenase expression/formation protein HypD|nr:hydrogenase formation protein HypD [Candidatus Bipolaricaulis anaerobius]HNS23578.1 hydrogenase formation protein HypD [Candidatus Bipolaricaulis anaerobius]
MSAGVLMPSSGATFPLRDPHRARALGDLIRRYAPPYPVRIVHVCGTHEMAIAQHGLRSLLPKGVEVLEGPGCPVCVTPTVDLDRAAKLATGGAILCTFGDMTRVPGTRVTLAEARAQGADVRVVLSAADAVDVARAHPDRDVVFFAVGFETTAPGTAAVLLDSPPPNFYVLSSHRLIPPALGALLAGPPAPIAGFLAPGHVSTIIGARAYRFVVERYHVPVVVAGFEPLDILYAIALILRQLREGRVEVENGYPRAVSEEGNLRAQALLARAFAPSDAVWRGIGLIPGSGLRIREELAHLDAERAFSVPAEPGEERPPGCLCSEVLLARAVPAECPLFRNGCTPLSPVGPCMVGSEGACNVWYRYGGRPDL